MAKIKVTGFEILDRMTVLRERAQILDDQFAGTLTVFADEIKPHPDTIIASYHEVEDRIGILQEIQARYNTTVKVTLPNGLGSATLERAIKYQGTIGRVKSLWKSVSGETAASIRRGYGYDRAGSETTRTKDPNIEHAIRVVPLLECQVRAQTAGEEALAVKQAIRSGNATVVEFDVPPGVLTDEEA